MDHRTWLWRKKSAEKTIVLRDRASVPLKGYEKQMEAYPSVRVGLDKDFKDRNDRVPSAIPNCANKDDLVKMHENMAHEAIAARDKAESESVSLRKKLDECLKQRAADEERLAHLDLALKQCVRQLQFVREEQEHRIHDAVMKVSNESEKSRVILEETLEETADRLAKVVLENNHLSKSLLLKERSVEDSSKQRVQLESEFSARMNRLDSMERDNASLKCKVRVLEKELDIRNEERAFSRRSAEISHKQHLESSKKVAKLESECQRLRLLVRKRPPGLATLTKMRNEADIVMRDPSTKRVRALTERLTSAEEENRALREALERKSNELQVSRNMYAQAASKLSQVVHMRNVNNLGCVHSLSLVSDMGSDGKASCTESWASALISELENFRVQKLKESPVSIKNRASEIDLMDDFVEMEKIAVSSANEPFKSRQTNISGRTDVILTLPLKGDLEEETDPLHSSIHKLPDWLQDILKLIVKQHRVNRRDPKEILEDIKTVLKAKHKKQQYPCARGDSRETLNRSISKIVELLERITFPSSQNNYSSPANLPNRDGNFSSSKTSETSTGYTARVIQWKTSELNHILQEFLDTCYNLLSEKANFCKFGQSLAFSLEWILNHCFSLQDVSSMREELVTSFDWDDTSDSEAEAGLFGQNVESVTLLADGAVATTGELKEDEMSNKERRQMAESLRSEIDTLRESKRMIEHQIQIHRSINEDLDRQLSTVRGELDDARQKSSSLEVELENKNSCCEELENTCLDLQLQLESLMQSKILEDEPSHEDVPLRTELEITAASEKLAECQETILNLGKQWKALASPEERSHPLQQSHSCHNQHFRLAQEKHELPALLAGPND